MTNREKWATKIAFTDELIEYAICIRYVTYSFGDHEQDCIGCPIKHLCDPYMNSTSGNGALITTEEYKASVSKWLDEEDEDEDD